MYLILGSTEEAGPDDSKARCVSHSEILGTRLGEMRCKSKVMQRNTQQELDGCDMTSSQQTSISLKLYGKIDVTLHLRTHTWSIVTTLFSIRSAISRIWTDSSNL